MLQRTTNQDASPGYPWTLIGESKRKVLEIAGSLIARVVIARINKLRDMPEGLNAVELVLRGYVDPIKVFVKNEPHSRRKLDSGILRLISSVGIVDECILKLLLAPQSEGEIDEWLNIPSKNGMGFTDKMVSDFVRTIPPGPRAATDISGMDWCWDGWAYDLMHKIYCRLMGQSLDSPFGALLNNVLYCLSLSVFVLSNGMLIAQLTRGVMKSGCYITGTGNSKLRVAAAVIASFRLQCPLEPLAQGDDANEKFHPYAVTEYTKLGFRIKEYKPCHAFDFEFCSHWFVDGIARPLNYVKGMVKLLSSTPSKMLLEQYQYENRHALYLGKSLAILRKVGWESAAFAAGGAAKDC